MRLGQLGIDLQRLSVVGGRRVEVAAEPVRVAAREQGVGGSRQKLDQPVIVRRGAGEIARLEFNVGAVR